MERKENVCSLARPRAELLADYDFVRPGAEWWQIRGKIEAT
jgi:hypothetical protein